ncbi:MAG: rhomboid family intramembrane serine protease [Planctomycetia bacterium]|nr:rhomboid family intramembrane serine protease [Planctomycetia bacterium]
MLFPFRDDVPRERAPFVTYALIACNVLSFLWFSQLAPLPQQVFLYQHAFVPARLSKMPDGDAIEVLVTVQGLQNGRPAIAQIPLKLPPDRYEVISSIFASMFMHGGWGHLLGNMWFLFLFGGNIEDRLGSLRYVLFYLVGGLMAAGVQWLDDPTSMVPMVGASGAIAALLGGYAITYPWARIHTIVWIIVFFTVIDLPAILFLGGWFVYQYISAKSDIAGGVAWWAHVGGFAGGLALMPWIDPRPRPEPTIDDAQEAVFRDEGLLS